MIFEWDKIDLWTHRAKVHDGWLVRERWDDSVSIVFVPDIHHLWKIEDISLPSHHQYLCATCNTIYPITESHGCAA